MRFVVRECRGYRIDPARVGARPSTLIEPTGYVVLDSAVGYRNCGEWWPGVNLPGEKGRGGSIASARCREIADDRARELNEAYQ